MNRRDYLEDLRKRISRLNREDQDEAISYYEEIFDERNIGLDDQVSSDMPSPRQASYEILMDVGLETETEEVETKKAPRKGISTITAVILSIMALPIALPLSIALVAVVVALSIALVAVIGSLVIAGIALVSASVYEMIFVLPQAFVLSRFVYLLGITFVSIAFVLLLIVLFRAIIKKVRSIIIKRKNRRSQGWK